MAYVTGNTKQQSASTSSISLSYTPANAGNALVISFGTHANNTISNVTPSAGADTTSLVAYSGNPITNANIASSDYGLYVWTIANCSAGGRTIQVQWTTNAGSQFLTVTEYSGRNTGSLVDATGTGADGSSTVNHSNGSVTTNLASDDLYFVGMGTGGGLTVTATGSWVADQTTTTNVDTITMYQNNVAIGTYTGTYHSSSSYFSMGILLALAAAPVISVPTPIGGLPRVQYHYR